MKWSRLRGGATALPDFQSPVDFETELDRTTPERNPGARSSHAWENEAPSFEAASFAIGPLSLETWRIGFLYRLR